jgi:TolB-like protein/class 3 adenylate cyclase
MSESDHFGRGYRRTSAHKLCYMNIQFPRARGCILSSEHVERRLAAILAADIAGYSRLMGANEEGTLAQLKSIRKALLDPAMAAHRGHIIKTTGDGMLVEFASAVDAVRNAVEIQRSMAEQNTAVPQDQRIEFRIGIHIGDIIFDDNDIFGDGVNIAARLEGIAEPGGVCMSDDAYRQVRGKVEIACDDMGPQSLKNIAEPMRAWRVRLTGQSPHAIQSGSAVSQTRVLRLPDKPSIAVLPFQNMSGDPEQEYFADGIVEEIITALSRFRQLFVIARNSTFTYKGRAVDVKQVGRELGVRYILEGSVRKAGNRVRIIGQLIDATTGAHLWADRFEGTLEDIFDLQDRVTASVVGAITPKLDQAEIERAKRKPTMNLDAYDYFLRGIAIQYLSATDANEEALRWFYQAIDLDHDFASAYGRAAWGYVWRKTTGRIADRVQETAETKRLAERAAELGNDDAVALSFAGFALAYVVGDIDAGAALTDRALALNPNLAMAWFASGWRGVWLGQTDLAIEHFARAMRLTPLDPFIVGRAQIGIAHAHFLVGRYEEAISWAQKPLRGQSDYMPALRILAAGCAMAGRLEEARREVARMRRIDPALRVSKLREILGPYRPEGLSRYEEGLRKAGLPG